MPRTPLKNADGRPRVHLTHLPDGACLWAINQGQAVEMANVGAALAAAMDAIGWQPAVIIWNGLNPQP